MIPRFCYYRLALQPKVVERIEADRAWAVVANELADKLNLNKQKECHKTIERKIPQAYLLDDFSQYPMSTQSPLADDYILKPGDKLHIKLVPRVFAPLPKNHQPHSNNNTRSLQSSCLTEEDRILQLCHQTQPQRKTPYSRPQARASQAAYSPKTTGIPKSMQKKYLEQTYK